MGSSSSKVARGSTRKYPTRAPGSAVPSAPPHTARPAPKLQSKTLGDGSKDEAIRADAMDPDFVTGDFSRRLHQMGVAEPNPTYSPSSTAAPQVAPQAPAFPSARSNQTLTALQARQQWQERAQEDLEIMNRTGTHGRRFLDMRTVVDAMRLRDQGMPVNEIEKRLRIQPGLLDKVGDQRVLSHITSPS